MGPSPRDDDVVAGAFLLRARSGNHEKVDVADSRSQRLPGSAADEVDSLDIVVPAKESNECAKTDPVAEGKDRVESGADSDTFGLVPYGGRFENSRRNRSRVAAVSSMLGPIANRYTWAFRITARLARSLRAASLDFPRSSTTDFSRTNSTP